MALSRFQSALQVFEAFPTMARDMAAPPSDEPPADLLAKLTVSASPEDAVTFGAYLLDRRQAVWWAARCLRQLGFPRGHDEDVALKLAEAWVRDPEEHRRVAALKLGIDGNHNLPPVWVALAAGSAGGTLRLGEAPGPPVPPHGTAQAVRTAILIALAGVPPRERQSRIETCVGMARELLARPEAG
jgi:hypothetical protein